MSKAVRQEDGSILDPSGVRYIGLSMDDDALLARMDENERTFHQPFHREVERASEVEASEREAKVFDDKARDARYLAQVSHELADEAAKDGTPIAAVQYLEEARELDRKAGVYDEWAATARRQARGHHGIDPASGVPRSPGGHRLERPLGTPDPGARVYPDLDSAHRAALALDPGTGPEVHIVAVERSAFAAEAVEVERVSEPMRIGKHEWRCVAFWKLDMEFAADVPAEGCERWRWVERRFIGYEWRSTECRGPWSRDTEWPAYDDHNGETAGMPKTLKKLYQPCEWAHGRNQVRERTGGAQ